MRDHDKSFKRFLPVVAVVGLRSFIHIEDVWRELQVYSSEYIRDGSPRAPSDAVAEDLDVVYYEDLDDGDWVVDNL